LYDLSVRTDRHTFTTDLALVVDMIRGLIYRDFDMPPSSTKINRKISEFKG
jgi:hypothetical protein